MRCPNAVLILPSKVLHREVSRGDTIIMLHLPAAWHLEALSWKGSSNDTARCVQVRVLVILIRNQERKEERRERKRR